MNMLVIIVEFVKYLIYGLWTGFTSFFKVLPLYEQLSSIKEEIIAAGLGVPAIVITILFAIPGIIKLTIKIINQFL